MEYDRELQINKEDLQILEGFRLLDDDFMTMVFQENKEATELLLNILLKRRDIGVMEVITQKEEKNPIIGGRSIVLDIFAKDSEGKTTMLRSKDRMKGQMYTGPDTIAALWTPEC